MAVPNAPQETKSARAPVPPSGVHRPRDEHVGDDADLGVGVATETRHIVVEGGLEGLERLEERDERRHWEGAD